MEEALAAIRQAITNDEAGEPTSRRATDFPRTSGRETNTRGWIAVAPGNCRSRLCVQHLDGNCTKARADAGGCGSRNASPHAEVMAGRKLAPRGRADGAGRSRTDYSRTLNIILAEWLAQAQPGMISICSLGMPNAQGRRFISWPRRLVAPRSKQRLRAYSLGKTYRGPIKP